MNQNIDENEYIFIADDEGNEEKFEIIYKFDYEEKSYILVVPSDEEDDDEEDEAEVYAFRYEETEDGYTLHTIEDDAEWDIIEEVFNTLNDELN